jgi:RHS repeat-associated protein
VSGGGFLSFPGSDSTSSSTFFNAQYTPGQYTVTVSRYALPAASIQVTVKPLVINLSGLLQIPQGETSRITATLSGMTPDGANNTAVNWFLSGGGTQVPDSTCSYCSTQMTTVTAGYVAGTYTLTAQSVKEPSVSTSVPLTVLPPPVASISPTTATLAAGQFVTFTGSAINTSDPNVILTTDDPSGYVNMSNNWTGSFSHFAGKPGGQFHVTAISERGGTPATATVTVVSVILSPTAVTVLPGTSRQFQGVVTGSQQAMQWSTTVPGATISSGGLLTVPAGTAAGSYSVTARTAGSPVSTATSTVTVASSIPVTGVAVSPLRSVLDSGAQESFVAVVQGQSGEPHPNQAVTWSVTGPAAATVAPNGLFTAPATPGVYTVQATAQADATKSGTATVTVGEDLMVSPAWASVAPGASVPFRAAVTGVANPAVTWSVAEGAAGGSISPAGLYVAPVTPGVYHVVAVSSSGGESVQGIATVVVSSSPQITIAVAPADAVVAAGATQQFTTTVTGAVDTGVTWSASAGSISPSGLYTAPATFGTVTVTATSHADSRVRAFATVVVADGRQGQGFQYDANGNLLSDGTRTFEWDAENRLTAINSTIISGLAKTGITAHRTEMGYDGLGRRVLITEMDNGVVTSKRHYVWVGNQIAEETDATQAPAPSPGSGGSFDLLDCNQLAGWAWDAAQPNTPINVDVYDGSTRIATVLASTYRGDLRAAGVGNGNHGFFYPTPAALKTGAAHSVTVKLGGTATVLGTRSVTCAAPILGGNFDLADCNQLAGWAWDANQPNSPINVDLYDGPTLLATVLASTFRQDLKTAGIGNGNHGFSYPTPPALKTGTAHTLTPKIGGTATVIGGSRTLTCAAPSFGGTFDSADCNQLAGWAWDANQPNSPINVDIYDGSTLLATVLASTFRQDLKNAGIGNGNHGFFYTSPAFYSGSAHSFNVRIGGTTLALNASPRSVTCPVEPILTQYFPGGLLWYGTRYFFSFDHLGSVREATDGAGNVVARYDYDPYGRLTVVQGVAAPFGFGGYFYHAPSGLSLTKYRAYDPDLGRWESEDPIGTAGGLNLYAYVDDDPTDGVDPLGLKKKGCTDKDPHIPKKQPKHIPPKPAPEPPTCEDQPLGICWPPEPPKPHWEPPPPWVPIWPTSPPPPVLTPPLTPQQRCEGRDPCDCQACIFSPVGWMIYQEELEERLHLLHYHDPHDERRIEIENAEGGGEL